MKKKECWQSGNQEMNRSVVPDRRDSGRDRSAEYNTWIKGKVCEDISEENKKAFQKDFV